MSTATLLIAMVIVAVLVLAGTGGAQTRHNARRLHRDNRDYHDAWGDDDAT